MAYQLSAVAILSENQGLIASIQHGGSQLLLIPVWGSGSGDDLVPLKTPGMNMAHRHACKQNTHTYIHTIRPMKKGRYIQKNGRKESVI